MSFVLSMFIVSSSHGGPHPWLWGCSGKKVDKLLLPRYLHSSGEVRQWTDRQGCSMPGGGKKESPGGDGQGSQKPLQLGSFNQRPDLLGQSRNVRARRKTQQQPARPGPPCPVSTCPHTAHFPGHVPIRRSFGGLIFISVFI